jgi:hypothetical protein
MALPMALEGAPLCLNIVASCGRAVGSSPHFLECKLQLEPCRKHSDMALMTMTKRSSSIPDPRPYHHNQRSHFPQP